MFKSGFAFVASHIDVTGTLPLEVLPGNLFRAARDSEIDIVKKLIASLIPSAKRSFVRWVNYESIVKLVSDDRTCHEEVTPLPRKDWKYWVIAFDGNEAKIDELELAACLLPFDLDIGFNVYFPALNQSGPMSGWGPPPTHIVEKYSGIRRPLLSTQVVDSRVLASLRSIWNAYVALPDEHSFVRRALQNYHNLKRIPQSSEFIVVGLFSIIESLITHAPRLTETLDSINHQVTNKLILLRKRYATPVQCVNYFLDASEATIWKKLYKYRSSIAHGNAVDLNSELKALRSLDSVVAFLGANVRELIAFALREPELISDLRAC